VPGCTDPLSKNFNPIATKNDGSCLYTSETVEPVFSKELSRELEETSGLIQWGNILITHNDDTDTNLYALDTLTGLITQKLPLPGVINKDWEEIAQDSTHMYIGDFGNNATGKRTDLKILKISKDSLMAGRAEANIITFTYSDQDMSASNARDKTDFDCEAMVITRDSIYLFTKQWNSHKTSLYALPKEPGTYVAQLKGTHDVDGLITGATYVEDKRLVVLTGYSMTLRPFFYLLYDFSGHDFFSGNKRKVNLKMRFHQVEGIATSDGLTFYITNEAIIKRPIINTKQQFHKFDLSPYLSTYLNTAESEIRRN
jgi:hypothetical protein